MDFKDISYLKNGNNRQREAYNDLTTANVFGLLHPFDPILTGTIPIAIDIAASDLDIVCSYKDPKQFIDHLEKSFGQFKDFHIQSIESSDTVHCTFRLNNFPIEIFAQQKPSEEQPAYLHMLKEYEILEARNASFRDEIIRLKNSGMKTEPAFAKLLGLGGNPYKALLDYKELKQ